MDDRGLNRALEDTVDEFRQRGTTMIRLDNRLPTALLTPNEEIHVLQIIREALSNVVRHADAANARVNLDPTNDGLQVLIEDDGRGMEGANDRAHHYGMTIMRERTLSLNMKGMHGLETLRRPREDEVDARVIMLTVSDVEDDIIAALQAGADGYLLKDMEPEDILDCLRRATRGHLVISERLGELLARSLRNESHPPEPSEAGLTPREQEILALIAKGLSNKLIARQLDLSVGTIKVHVKHTLKKLKLRSRVEAAVWAINSGADQR